MFREPIDINEAVQHVMEFSKKGKVETISFEVCDNRYLGEDIKATSNVPAFEKSPYDGFAVRSIDLQKASEINPVELKVLETIGAGELSRESVGQQEAVRIMTGAELPNGADGIIMLEECEEFTEESIPFIRIKRKVSERENVMEIGSEVKNNELLIKKGSQITPGIKAVLATFGYANVVVGKQPVVGVLATGTELLNVDEPLQRGKIRNSNGYMIQSQVKKAGGLAIDYGKLPDELEPSYNKMKEILDEVDLLITTGGVSVGDFDLIPDIYEKLGAKILFNKVAMRPGSVTTVAVHGEKLLFGLSGNPSACYVGFELFARPIMQTLLQSPQPYVKKVTATLMVDFPKANPFNRFVRAYYTLEDGRFHAHLAGIDKSNVVTSLAHATCFMILPGGTSSYKKGDTVELLLLNESMGDKTFLIK